MQDADYAARIDAVKQRAHGRWSEVLAAAGVEERILRHRNGPCPSCGGTDRFQYTDKFGEGNYHCRNCGPGGGFKLLQAVKGVDFKSAVRQVQEVIGAALAAGEHPGDRPVLRRYERARKGANASMLHVITGLNRLFATDSALLKELRTGGMRLFNRSGPVRQHVVNVALGIRR